MKHRVYLSLLSLMVTGAAAGAARADLSDVLSGVASAKPEALAESEVRDVDIVEGLSVQDRINQPEQKGAMQ